MRLLLMLCVFGCEDLVCGEPCRDTSRPIQGSAGDFDGPRDAEGLTVSAAEACPAPEPCHFVRIAAVGEVELEGGAAGAWFAENVSPHFDGLRLYLYRGLTCDRERVAFVVEIDDWALLDPLLDRLAEALVDDDLEATFEVRVKRETIACPNVACGV